MCKRRFILLFFCLVLAGAKAGAQTKYWVFFRDKKTPGFDPWTFFDPKAIDRRVKTGVALYDYSDLPVNQEYIDRVEELSDSLGQPSRWFNGVGTWINPEKLDAITQLPFVREIVPMTTAQLPAEMEDITPEDSQLIGYQISRLGGELFLKNGIRGKGVRIAVLDVGFRGAREHPAFKHLFANRQILSTYDFITKDTNVYHKGTHGTMVLSCLAGMYKDTIPMGLAQDAEFLLARTERTVTEWKDEEDNWLAAVEWADQKGADIISSSLGYTDRRYFPENMNGHTSIVSRAANLAARKGMLVVIAAGNEAKGTWKYICTPGDADSALTIGATNPLTNYHANFSSFGPSADGEMKPNVCAPGYAWVADVKEYTSAMGTSFSTPLVAGFAACAWQLFPKWTNMELYRQLEKSAQLYPYFDYAHGYGTPQAGFFIRDAGKKKKGMPEDVVATFHFDTAGGKLSILTDKKYITGAAQKGDEPKLYYSIADSRGRLVHYYVVEPNGAAVIPDWGALPPHGLLRVYFEGSFEEKKY